LCLHHVYVPKNTELLSGLSQNKFVSILLFSVNIVRFFGAGREDPDAELQNQKVYSRGKTESVAEPDNQNS